MAPLGHITLVRDCGYVVGRWETHQVAAMVTTKPTGRHHSQDGLGQERPSRFLREAVLDWPSSSKYSGRVPLEGAFRRRILKIPLRCCLRVKDSL